MTLLRHLPRFRYAERALPELAARERWGRADIAAFQLDRLNRVWAHAAAHVPYYRALADAARLPRRFDSLEEFTARVPVLTKAAVRSRPHALLSTRRGPGTWRLTGGSTGVTTRVFWSSAAHREMLRCKYRFHQQWGIGIFDRTAFLWGHAASFAPGLKGRMARLLLPVNDRLRNRVRLSAYDLGSPELRRHLRRIAAARPAVIYAYSTAAYLLALEAEQVRFHCDSLKAVILTSEPAYPYIIAAAQRAFGVPAVVEYGSMECGFIAGEAPDHCLRVREDVVLIETVPRPDGRYDVVLTVLNNPAFPLLRYAIGDVVGRPLERPAEGFAILRDLLGRTNDLILTRSGRCLHSAPLEHVFELEQAVRCYQVHQRRDGALSVAVELQPGAGSIDIAKLGRRLQDFVEGYPVEIQLVDRVPQTAAGKHRWIFSDMVQLPIDDRASEAPARMARRG